MVAPTEGAHRPTEGAHGRVEDLGSPRAAVGDNSSLAFRAFWENLR
jgi:hypothetical protein